MDLFPELSTAVHKFANVFSPLPTLARGEG
jgi:hypothetical protein